MDQLEPSDLEGLALVKRAMADLAQGTWRPDFSKFEAAIETATKDDIKAQLANLLTHHHFRSGDMERALAACEIWRTHSPETREAHESHAGILIRLGRYAEALAAAEARLATEPDNHRLYALLAHAASQLGDRARARRFGNECLALQDRQPASPPLVQTTVKVPAFDQLARDRNIISFSLFGTDPTYIQGAIRNVVAAQLIYPEWTCRFYIDETVPKAVVRRIEREGGTVRQVFRMPADRFGTFWRFLVAQDMKIDRYLVRDCDSCLNLRERAAVEDWIASGQAFHVMRDGPTHTDLVLAGMWGGVRGGLLEVGPSFQHYCRTAPHARTVDQMFLRDWAWPRMKSSVLIHDSFFDFGDAKPFPPRAEIPGLRVGRGIKVKAA